MKYISSAIAVAFLMSTAIPVAHAKVSSAQHECQAEWVDYHKLHHAKGDMHHKAYMAKCMSPTPASQVGRRSNPTMLQCNRGWHEYHAANPDVKHSAYMSQCLKKPVPTPTPDPVPAPTPDPVPTPSQRR
jgi:hypothetical protein